nr:histone-lysine N-methyltransferase ASHR1-like isoform X2 [Aedes albopictus]
MKIESGERVIPEVLKKGMNLESNLSIPCLAKGVGTGEFPHYGRGMKAEQDFKVGDVILREGPAMVNVDTRRKFQACHHCASDNVYSLIPCPHCVFVIYCNEECLTNGWKECHRFECGIKDRLNMVPHGIFIPGLTWLFYGLTQFNDSLDDMMNYCKENDRNGNDPLSLEYTNPLDIFKLFHTAKVKPLSPQVHTYNRFILAILYDIYLEHPLVGSLFVGENQRNFLLQAMDDYMTMATRMSIGVRHEYKTELYSIASLCNHSCNPNAHALYSSGQIKIVVVSPIQKGEQICISYGYVKDEVSDARFFAQMGVFDFTCICQVCAPNSSQEKLSKNRRQPHHSFHSDLRVLNKIIENENSIASDRINALQQFIQRYAEGHPPASPLSVLVRARVRVISEEQRPPGPSNRQ